MRNKSKVIILITSIWLVMYIAKIPGTRYVTSLESDGGRWVLRLKLEGVVEAEEEVSQMKKRELHNNLGDLFDQVNLQINSFQHDLIHSEIIAQINHLLMQDETMPVSEPKKDDDIQREDPRVDELIEKIEKLEEILSTLEDRVDRMEALSSAN